MVKTGVKTGVSWD